MKINYYKKLMYGYRYSSSTNLHKENKQIRKAKKLQKKEIILKKKSAD